MASPLAASTIDRKLLNLGMDAQVDSVSCASAGKCSAGGVYRDGSSLPRGFVASQS
jgi:hypothetical protein